MTFSGNMKIPIKKLSDPVNADLPSQSYWKLKSKSLRVWLELPDIGHFTLPLIDLSPWSVTETESRSSMMDNSSDDDVSRSTGDNVIRAQGGDDSDDETVSLEGRTEDQPADECFGSVIASAKKVSPKMWGGGGGGGWGVNNRRWRELSAEWEEDDGKGIEDIKKDKSNYRKLFEIYEHKLLKTFYV